MISNGQFSTQRVNFYLVPSWHNQGTIFVANTVAMERYVDCSGYACNKNTLPRKSKFALVVLVTLFLKDKYNSGWLTVNNVFCHEWGDSKMNFMSDVVTCENHWPSDPKSLSTISHALFYFLHASLWLEHKKPLLEKQSLIVHFAISAKDRFF